MAAMHRTTGKLIDGLEEIEQSIDEILDTVPGDRVMRADYGSRLFELVDGPMDASGRMAIAQAVGEAIRKFEPRVNIERVVTEGEPGTVTQTIIGTVSATHERVVVKR